MLFKINFLKWISIFFSLLVLAIITHTTIAAPFSKKNSDSDLKISNSSTHNLTFKINQLCSNEIGVVSAHSIKVIPFSQLQKACRESPAHCEAEIYATDNCTGHWLATVTFDLNFGVKAIIVSPQNIYFVSASAFNLFLAGPWN